MRALYALRAFVLIGAAVAFVMTVFVVCHTYALSECLNLAQWCRGRLFTEMLDFAVRGAAGIALPVAFVAAIAAAVFE